MAGPTPDITPHSVQLRHMLPDGSEHVDWMLDLAASAGPLTTFRLTGRIDELAAGAEAEAVRIADHRRVYLDYEGEVSGGRGVVERLASGWFEAMQSVGDTWGLLIRWECPERPPRRQQLRLSRIDDDRWRIVVLRLV